MPIGMPGWPEFAFCTASIASTRSAAAFIQWSACFWRRSAMFTGKLPFLHAGPRTRRAGKTPGTDTSPDPSVKAHSPTGAPRAGLRARGCAGLIAIDRSPAYKRESPHRKRER